MTRHSNIDWGVRNFNRSTFIAFMAFIAVFIAFIAFMGAFMA